MRQNFPPSLLLLEMLFRLSPLVFILKNVYEYPMQSFAIARIVAYVRVNRILISLRQ